MQWHANPVQLDWPAATTKVTVTAVQHEDHASMQVHFYKWQQICRWNRVLPLIVFCLYIDHASVCSPILHCNSIYTWPAACPTELPIIHYIRTLYAGWSGLLDAPFGHSSVNEWRQQIKCCWSTTRSTYSVHIGIIMRHEQKYDSSYYY